MATDERWAVGMEKARHGYLGHHMHIDKGPISNYHIGTLSTGDDGAE